MNMIIKWFVSSIVIFAAAYVFPGISVDNYKIAIVAAVVLGLINLIIKPIVVILTLPINILTLGLFTFIINAGLVLLAAYLVSGFSVVSFWWALLLSLVLSIVNISLKNKKKD